MSSHWIPRLLALLLAGTVGAAEPEKSVIQIFNFSQEPEWANPWRFKNIGRGSGTGFLVQGRKIMTNAHVVSWGRQILVKRYQDPRTFQARVVHIAHECDLALLEVEDSDFFEGMEPLEMGPLPAVRSTVVTYGYPAGGQQISYTRGVVSRIELQKYVHVGNRSFLTVQTDAAINPGNSGGPVIQDGKVVGVSFQGTSALENTGFFIPPSVVNHFLEDIEDGRYDGFPMAGISVATLENPAYRRRLKLEEPGVGARVDHLLAIDSTRELLRKEDVLLEVQGYKVGSDGTIVYEGNRLSVAHAFQLAQHGSKVPISVWRDGKRLDIELPVQVYEKDRAAGNQYDMLPRYYIYGGLVFTPLSLDYMKSLGRGFDASDTAAMIYELTYRPREAPETTRREPVVLADVLAGPSNANVQNGGGVMVDSINGIRIESLEDVIRALEGTQVDQHILKFLPDGSLEGLDRKQAEAGQAALLATYGITQDRRL